MYDTRIFSAKRVLYTSIIVFASRVILAPDIGWAQVVAGPAKLEAQSQLQADNQNAKYRAVVNRLADVELEIFSLQRSDAQRDFEKIESTLVALQAKRKRLDELELQWKLLGDGTPALEIEPRLNMTEQDERQLLIELEGSKEQVLRHKAELLRLKSEFGPGHPAIVRTSKQLVEMQSVVEQQTEALEDLGVEIKSAVAKQKLKHAKLQLAELKTKFGPGHPSMTLIESEIGMLETEVLDSPVVMASHQAPALDLIHANLELREAQTKFGSGHPVFKTLKRKIEVLEQLAETEAVSETPDNKKELAARLEARIEALQNRILTDESELDSFRVKKPAFKSLEDKTNALLKQRSELSAEMTRLSPTVKPAAKLDDQKRVAAKRSLLDAIKALELLGKLDDANRLRLILVELTKQ